MKEKFAQSLAEFEHKAFLFDSEKNLLVIPGRMRSGQTNFNGVFAFFISKTQITFRSAIDHMLNKSDDFENRNVQRSVYIEEMLYTKSFCLLRINRISKKF